MKTIEDTIVFKTHEKYIQIPIIDIIFCKSQGCYTIFFLENGVKYTVCGTLKTIVHNISGIEFLRIHNSFLINKSKIKAFSSKHRLVFIGDFELPISKKKYKVVLQYFFLNHIQDTPLRRKSSIL